MAAPVWYSHDQPGFFATGNAVHAQPGNWRQGQGGDALVNPRFIYIWFVDGVQVAGQYPPMRSDADQHFSGEGMNSFISPTGTHQVHFEVVAGGFYHNPPDPFIGYEWGRGHVTNTAEAYREPATGEITISSTPPPPKTTVADCQTKLAQLTHNWMSSGARTWVLSNVHGSLVKYDATKVGQMEKEMGELRTLLGQL